MTTLGGASAGASIWIPAALILVGLAGIVVPVLPGLVLVVVGVLVWALGTGTGLAWGVFAFSVVLYAAGVTLQVVLPGRRMKAAGVGWGTLLLAVGLGVVGMVVIPVVGAPVGFVLGIYLVELSRDRTPSAAWASTKVGVRAVVHSMGIELVTGLGITVVWAMAVALSR